MSASLTGRMGRLHDHKDDLESSFYTLLWVTLMYSDCSKPEKVPSLLRTIFEGGFLAKADFLKGRTFLDRVSFPGRGALHTLFDELAQMFAVRYEQAPTKQDRDRASRINSYSTEYYETTSVYKYDKRMSSLNTHAAIIDLFEAALRDRSQWPPNDPAVKQRFHHDPVLHELVTKSGWNTTLFVEQLESGDDAMEAQPNRENEVDD